MKTTLLVSAAVFCSCSFAALPAARPLPAPVRTGGMPLQQALNARRTIRSYKADALTDQQISDLLWSANGVNRNDGKRIPIPRWYWKAVLKVQRDTLGVPVQAASIAFFLPHEDLKGHQYKEYVIPVDSLESLTGFDFFPALSDSLEVACEARADWDAFKKF